MTVSTHYSLYHSAAPGGAPAMPWWSPLREIAGHNVSVRLPSLLAAGATARPVAVLRWNGAAPQLASR